MVHEAQTLTTACPLDCPDACSLEVHVEGDRVVAVGGSRVNPVTEGYICAKVRRSPEPVLVRRGRLLVGVLFVEANLLLTTEFLDRPLPSSKRGELVAKRHRRDRRVDRSGIAAGIVVLEARHQPVELLQGEQAVELGLSAVALTDHDGICGTMEFAQAGRAFGVRPIVGAELTAAQGTSNPAAWRAAARGIAIDYRSLERSAASVRRAASEMKNRT